jgi:hypothetical protein
VDHQPELRQPGGREHGTDEVGKIGRREHDQGVDDPPDAGDDQRGTEQPREHLRPAHEDAEGEQPEADEDPGEPVAVVVQVEQGATSAPRHRRSRTRWRPTRRGHQQGGVVEPEVRQDHAGPDRDERQHGGRRAAVDRTVCSARATTATSPPRSRRPSTGSRRKPSRTPSATRRTPTASTSTSPTTPSASASPSPTTARSAPPSPSPTGSGSPGCASGRHCSAGR